jgi:hypothetical protein
VQGTGRLGACQGAPPDGPWQLVRSIRGRLSLGDDDRGPSGNSVPWAVSDL